jgi:uncharacterized protein
LRIFTAMPEPSIQLSPSIRGLDREGWNALNQSSGACPFLSWEFLALLEESGAVGEAAGWQPLYAILLEGGRWLAAAPFYAVADPRGQFTWDGGMEAAAAGYGLSWFPKLVGMVPFTPSPLWRPLAAPGPQGFAHAQALVEAVAGLAREGGYSALHLQWLHPPFADELAADGGPRWLAWRRQAYLWENQGYPDFEGYLSSFSKNMRRNVKREQAGLAARGVSARVLPAAEAPRRYWDLMADYYERTNGKFGPWAAHFLPRAFFELAPLYLGPYARFSAAFSAKGREADAAGAARAAGGDGEEPLALALLMEGGGRLWGRYWGAREDLPGLHFDVCYYRPIAYAIERGLESFDPGMGGDHKARRGFKAVVAASLHRVFDRRLAALFGRALKEASAAEEAFAAELNRELPFKARP